MATLANLLTKLSDVIDRQVGNVLMALLAAEIVVVFAAVVARYVFNNSFAWSDEVSRGMLTWLIFLGATACCKRSELLGITVVPMLLPKLGRRIVAVFVSVLMIGFLIWTIDLSIDLMQRTYRQSTIVLRLPLNYITAAIPVGFAIMTLHLLVDVLKVVRDEEDELSTAKVQGL